MIHLPKQSIVSLLIALRYRKKLDAYWCTTNIVINTITHQKQVSHFMAKGMNELAHKSPLILSSTSVDEFSCAITLFSDAVTLFRSAVLLLWNPTWFQLDVRGLIPFQDGRRVVFLVVLLLISMELMETKQKIT